MVTQGHSRVELAGIEGSDIFSIYRVYIYVPTYVCTVCILVQYYVGESLCKAYTVLILYTHSTDCTQCIDTVQPLLRRYTHCTDAKHTLYRCCTNTPQTLLWCEACSLTCYTCMYVHTCLHLHYSCFGDCL